MEQSPRRTLKQVSEEVHWGHSLLTIKAVQEDAQGKRIITGIATTPTPDRVGDIVDPLGAEFSLPMPLLYQHDSSMPVGWVKTAKPTKDGIPVVMELAQVQEPGTLRERLELAWQEVKIGLVRGLSIGFKSLEAARIGDSYSYRFLKWLWLELSLVTIPMNGEATITAVKSADELARRAAFGASGGLVVPKHVAAQLHPGGSGTSSLSQPLAKKGNAMKISEQLAAFEARRKTAQEKMEAIMTKAADEGRVLTTEESEEYDTLVSEVKAIGEHITRLSAHEAAMVQRAAVVDTSAASGAGGAGSAVHVQGNVLSVKRNLDKGIPFTRYVMALARAKGNIMQAAEISKRWDSETPEVGIVLRAAVAAGTTSDATWAGPLVQYQQLVSEFIDFLRPMTVLGRLTLRRVPFNVRIPRQTAGVTGQFVGEGAPAPVNKLDFDSVTLPWAKASCIVVLSEELVRLGNPSAEMLARNDLAAGIAQYLDKRFLDPSYAGVANVSPASVLNDVTGRASTGTTLGALDDDVNYLYGVAATANLNLRSSIWVTSPHLAIALSTMRTSQDIKVFPNITMDGGTDFYGLPMITSNNAQAGGSPTDKHLILIDQDEILLADDGQMMIDMSSEASLQMNDAPSAGAQSLVSLWQNGLLGVKVDRWIYWTKRRSSGAAQYIDNANYS